jgi:hypothetical protein
MLQNYLKAIAVASFTVTPAISNAENRIDIQRPDASELAAYGEFDIGVRQVKIVNKNQIDILKIDPKSRNLLSGHVTIDRLR